MQIVSLVCNPRMHVIKKVVGLEGKASSGRVDGKTT